MAAEVEAGVSPGRYVMKHDQMRDLGCFALGVMEVVAASHPSRELREFAQGQLDGWVRHGFIEVAE